MLYLIQDLQQAVNAVRHSSFAITLTPYEDLTSHFQSKMYTICELALPDW